MSCVELLAQTHLHARGRLRRSGVLRESAELNPGRLPGILQRRAAGTRAGVLAGRHPLDFAQGGIALRVQSNRVKFFARHLLLPLHEKKSTIALRWRVVARREAFPAWPSARPARGATASESFRSGIPPYGPL